jgi:hypothetical protein
MRPHIEFIHVDDVPWQPWPFGSTGACTRTLSCDPDTGATTLLVSLPAGWAAPEGFFTADVEFYIMQGELVSNGYRLARHTYGFLPAGVVYGRLQASSPVTLLWFTHGESRFAISATDAPGARRRGLIHAMDSSAAPWSNPITPGFPPGAMRKSLRIDPDTGAGTWLLGVLPQWREPRVEIHPVAEEAFIISGEMVTDRGVMVAGCYFWRPPHIPHGPFATETGALILFRTDGHLHTFYRWPDQPSGSSSGSPGY